MSLSSMAWESNVNTIADLTDIIIENPNRVYTFIPINDMEDDDCIWYGAVMCKVFDVWNLMLNQWTLIGGKPLLVDLPDYDGDEADLYTKETIVTTINKYLDGNELVYIDEGVVNLRIATC